MKRAFITSSFVVPVLTLLFSAAQADDKWMIRLAGETGGDDIVNIAVVGGSTSGIQAGGLFHAELGRQFQFFANSPAMLTELSAGYKFETVSFTDGDLSFSRITLNAMHYLQYTERVKFGFGITFHVAPTFEKNVNGLVGDVKADNALGFLIGADYSLKEYLSIGARLTQIDYEFAGEGERFTRNSVGVYGSFYF